MEKRRNSFRAKSWQQQRHCGHLWGKFVPRQIYYNDQGTPVTLHKKPIPACHRCHTVGHRTDIPRPKPGSCGQCGSDVATTLEGPVERKFPPRCLICGADHLTGKSGCNGK
ncbi:hypothetical protein HPB48_019544 [Haemaphysalis longicornis]|uniref:Uncharacterized protein n=1 Tax=Haemaphysalis longicornis TaxID=44386 RepID=A0A9J6GJD1_HAELO|nr:hypothetical protein HPB48_019544 [Haemaphysalis longicornis]